MNKFRKWIETFISEKNIDPQTVIEVEGKSGTNMIPVACLIDAMETAPERERRAIKNTIVRIDFVNGDVMDYFRHLAKAIAL